MKSVVRIFIFFAIPALFFRYGIYHRSFNLYGNVKSLINMVNIQELKRTALNIYATALLKKSVASEYPGFRPKNDFETSSLIRRWVAERTAWTSTPSADMNTVKDYLRVVSFARQDRLQPPLLCSTISEILDIMYSLFSFESYRYHFGRLDDWNHVSSLVKIKQKDKELFVLQDSSMDISFVDRAGNPYDFYKLLRKLADDIEDTVLVEQADKYAQFVCNTKTRNCRETRTSPDVHGYEEKVSAETIEKLLNALVLPRQVDETKTNPQAKEIMEIIQKIIKKSDSGNQKIPQNQIMNFRT